MVVAALTFGCDSDGGGAGPTSGPDAAALDAAALDAAAADASAHDAGDIDSAPGPEDAAPSDAGPLTCTACHGAGDQPAPPRDVAGGDDPSRPGVGAHAAHLGESDGHAEVKCRHCHPVPPDPDADGHRDDARPADVEFSGVASSGGDAEYVDGTCAVYCHGSALRFEQRRSPPWTAGGPLGCDGCHALPPPAPHPPSAECGACHIDLMAPSGRAFRAPRFHIDSVLQAPHGAHLAHLGGAGGPTLVCTWCHDGTHYHGPLRDGAFIAETTLCDECHPAGSVGAEAWRGYAPPMPE